MSANPAPPLAWPLLASLLLHGAALAWLPLTPLAVAEPAAPIELQLQPAPTSAQPQARRQTRDRPHTPQASASSRPAPEPSAAADALAHSAPTQSLPSTEVRAGVSPAALASTAMNPGPALAAPDPAAAGVMQAPAPVPTLRTASASDGMAAPSAVMVSAGGAAPTVETTALAKLDPTGRAHGELRIAPGPRADPAAVRQPGGQAPSTDAGPATSQAHVRDKTPWQGAPLRAQAAGPEVIPAPQVAFAGEMAATPQPARARTSPEPHTLRATAAAPLSLVEAEGAPSTAIAVARLKPEARACFAPPPPHWNAQGRVLLRIRVDANGRASEVSLDSGSGEPRLDRLAMQQARDCALFEIYDAQGRPRAALVRLPVVYRYAD